MQTYTITLTKDEMIECAEALHNQGIHLNQQYRKNNYESFKERAEVDRKLADKFIDTMRMIYIYDEELLKEETAL